MADGLNNLYVNDKHDRDRDDFDGSGIGGGKFTKQAEFKSNLKSVSLFILLNIIAAVLLLMALAMVGKDIYTKANGQYIIVQDAKLGSDGKYDGQYDGKNYSFERNASVLKQKDGSLKVYYKGNSYYDDSKGIFIYICIYHCSNRIILIKNL